MSKHRQQLKKVASRQYPRVQWQETPVRHACAPKVSRIGPIVVTRINVLFEIQKQPTPTTKTKLTGLSVPNIEFIGHGFSFLRGKLDANALVQHRILLPAENELRLVYRTVSNPVYTTLLRGNVDRIVT